MGNTSAISPLKLLTLGYSVIPSGAGDKGKSPKVNWTEFQSRFPTDAELEIWENESPPLWGIVTGKISGVVIIDVDEPEKYKIFETQNLKPHIKTPRGGYHYWFKHPGFHVKTRAGLLPGLDVRGDGGFVNVMGTNPKTGIPYEIQILPTQDTIYPWDSIPAPISKLIKEHDRREIPSDSQILSGKRNDTLARIAGVLRRDGATKEEIESRLLRENKERCNPPLPENEVLTIARSISHYQPTFTFGNGRKSAENLIETLNFTDSENGEYFTALYGDIFRYDHRRDRWLEWNGVYWRTDTNGQIMRLALKSARSRFQATTTITESEIRKVASKKAIESEQRARLDNALALARNFLPIADSGEEWDKNPWLFACKNGVINLKTGKLQPGKQDDKITMRSEIEFQPEAGAPRWTQFLNEIFAGDTELIDWIQRYLGYCLTGNVKEQIIPIGYGNGANGKTVLMVVLRHLFGDYGYDAPFNTFELYNRNPIPNDLAALEGRRFVTSSETNEGSRFNEARIKSLTGGDSVTARFLHCEYFTYQPVAKFFLAVNHRPRVDDDSYGFWRRVRLIPFTQQFKGKADDKELTSKLKIQSPGILTWMVDGCLKWQEQGLDPAPDCIMAATRDYEAESDPLAEFLHSDECVDNPQAKSQSSHVYKKYKEYCFNQGMQEKEVLTLTAFGRRMGKNYKKMQNRDGVFYDGLALKCEGFVKGFDSISIKNTLIPPRNLSREFNDENPSQPLNPPQETPPCELPACPKCGADNLWEYAHDGKELICECGYKEKVTW